MIKPGENPLAPLLLEIAGRYTVDPYDGRRHHRILVEALPHLNQAQQAFAQTRIKRLETKWGNLLKENPEEDEKLPENEQLQLIARWLSKKHEINALVTVLIRAAKTIGAGTNALRDIHEYAYETQIDRSLRPVSYETFEKWLISLRIGKRETNGAGKVIWDKGPWHSTWSNVQLISQASAQANVIRQGRGSEINTVDEVNAQYMG